jgi:hypothetical protein
VQPVDKKCLVYKKIPGISDKYLAGSDGFVYSSYGKGDSLRRLRAGVCSGGNYFNVSVIEDVSGKRKSFCVHTLICRAFHGLANDGYSVAHLDGNSMNNVPENLSWKTMSDNLKDRFLHGTHDSGINNTRAVLDRDSLFVVRWLLSNTKISHQSIAELMGCSRLTVTKVKNGNRYGNVKVSTVASVNDLVYNDAKESAEKYISK